MSEHATKFKYSNKGQKFAIILLIFVVIITVLLWVYNHVLSSKIDDMSTTIEEHKTTITALKKEKEVYVYNLMTLHGKSLDMLDKRSNISEYILHLQEISGQYNVDFRGFNLSNWNITTKAQFNTNDTGVSYNKAVRFIWDYRKSDSALFDLNFVSSIESTDLDVKIPVEFSLK